MGELKYEDGTVYIKDNVGWRPLEPVDIDWDPPAIGPGEFDVMVEEAERQKTQAKSMRW